MPVSTSTIETSPTMTAANLFLQVGWKSFEYLSNVFSNSLLGGNGTENNNDSTLEDAMICGSSHVERGLTQFHLNPFDTDGSVWTMKLQSSQQPVSCAGTDWVIILILVCIIHCLSWIPRWMVWEPLADAYKSQSGKTTTWNKEECRRFSMTVTSCMFFTISAIFGYRVLAHKSWLFDRYAWTERSPAVETDFKFYYLVYASRFISDSISLFFESRNRDAFIASFLHHVVTLGLVFGSAVTGFTKYGGIIMFFFDWADIPLLAAKACKYLSDDTIKNDPFQLIANRLFEVFAVTFFCTRNVWYNYIVYSAWKDLDGDVHSRFCRYMLLLLAGLQTYWLWLIISAVIRQKKSGGRLEDSRDAGIRQKKTN
mmetsp:Transcript_40117/g.96870  ORF Transcript_40117/g.96870 Transcript_40117/m.96870 type:complete len:369 (+) Transcript_40117:62-1168(+)